MESSSFHCFDSSRIGIMFSEEQQEVNKRDDDERDWAGLPVELLEKIHSLLLYGDGDCDGPTRFRFHLTCKSWQSIRMNHPQNQHPLLFSIPTHSIQSAQRFQQVPMLMSTFTWKKNDAGTCKVLHPVYKETYVIDYPEIAGAFIVHSKYGWLLMHRDRSLFFFNPFTRTTIPNVIPKFGGFGFFNISFTAPPTSPDCMLFSYENSVHMYCFRLGQDENWRHYEISYEIEELESALQCPMCSPVFCNGGFYWFDISGKLGFFNAEEEGNNRYKKVVGSYISAHMNYITEYDGELYTIAVGKNGSYVRVFKLDCSGAKVLRSVELKSLGNKTIYISDIGTLLVAAKVKGTENKIYFPRFVDEEGIDEESIYYCLRTCRYHFFGCRSPCGDWNGTKVRNHCAWIEPDVDTECGGEEEEETPLSLYNIGGR